MRRRAAEEYDVETLELIDVLNFENWMHYNKELVGVLYIESMNVKQLCTDDRFREVKLSRTFKKGIEFGALLRDGKWGICHLTNKARKYFVEMEKQEKRNDG